MKAAVLLVKKEVMMKESMYEGAMLTYLLVWLLLLVMGGTGRIVVCSLFEGNEVLSGYATILGMCSSFISGIFL